MRRAGLRLAAAPALAGILAGTCARPPGVNPAILQPGAPGHPDAPARGGTPAAAGGADLIFLTSETVTVPAGTELLAVLAQDLDTARTRAGDTFQARLHEPLKVGDRSVAPQGAALLGQATESRTAGPELPSLSINLLQILVNDRWFVLYTDLVSAGAAAGGGGPAAPSGPAAENGRVLPAGQPLRFQLIQDAVLGVGARPEGSGLPSGAPSGG